MQTIEDLQDRHDQMLNEATDKVRIGTLEYFPSDVLKKVDPIAYKQSVLDYADAEDIDTDELDGDWDL